MVTRSTDDMAARLASDLRHSVGAFVRAVRRDTDTTKTAQSEALHILHHSGPINVATLAARRGVTHQTMRLVVAQLESAGLVRQDDNPADRRSRLVSISTVGCVLLAQEQDRRADRIETAIRSRLSIDEQRLLRAAISILDRLAAPLDIPSD